MRRLMRTSRKRLALLVVGMAAVLVVGGASGSPTVTIGQTDPEATIGSGTAAWFVQTGDAPGTEFVVPPGNWNITGWRTYAIGSGPQSMSMMIFRPDGLGDLHRRWSVRGRVADARVLEFVWQTSTSRSRVVIDSVSTIRTAPPSSPAQPGQAGTRCRSGSRTPGRQWVRSSHPSAPRTTASA